MRFPTRKGSDHSKFSPIAPPSFNLDVASKDCTILFLFYNSFLALYRLRSEQRGL